jgi:putative two-component system response regulator
MMVDDIRQDSGSGGKKIIMAVDDSAASLLAISTILGKNFDVRLCNGSKSAFLMLERYKPDLILLDIEMPGMSGFEFIKEFKQKYPDDQIPVIFVSSHKTEDAVISAVKSGAKDYIVKPFTSDILQSKVFEVLNATES